MTRRSLVMALTGIGLLAVSTAAALPLNQHAVSWHAARGADQQFINRSTLGISNSATVAKTVVGAPVRNPHANGNQVVSITGWHSSMNVTTRCTISTHNSSGTQVASKTFCISSTAPGCVVPPAPPAYWIQNTAFSVAEAPFSTSYAVFCTLLPPGVNTNRIHSARVNP